MEHPAYTLGALTLGGGIMGYARKKSVPSLVAGTTISVLYFTAGYLIQNGDERGITTALVTSSLMMVAGIGRAFQAGSIKKPVPALLVSLGAVSTYYYATKYRQIVMD